MAETLLLGDCLELMADIPAGSVDAVITDPPYGATSCGWDNVIVFEPMWAELERIAKKRAAIVLFGSQPFTSALVMSNPRLFRYCWSWIKNMGTGIGTANKRPMKYHEDICVFYKAQATYNKQPTARKSDKGKAVVKRGVRGSHKTVKNRTISEHIVPSIRYYDPDNVNPRSYLEIECVPNGGGGKVHPTQKPVALLEYLVKTYTNEGETVLDFTMGSGTTGVACKRLGRDFIGIEINEEYYEIAKKRIDEPVQKALRMA